MRPVLILLLCAAFCSCRKEYSCEQCEPTLNPTPIDTTVSTPTLFADFMMDGQQIYLREGVEGIERDGGSIKDLNAPAICINDFMLIGLSDSDNNSEQPHFSWLGYLNTQNISPGGDYNIIDFYYTGEYQFAYIPGPLSTVPCLTGGRTAITFGDFKNVWWATYLGSQEQTGSSFEVTKVEQIGDAIFIYAQFDCYLYNYQGDRQRAIGKFCLSGS